MASKIRWTDRELLSVAERLPQFVELEPRSRRLTLERAMKEALPKDRWRDMHNASVMWDRLKPFHELVTSGKADRMKAPPESVAVTATPLPENPAPQPSINPVREMIGSFLADAITRTLQNPEVKTAAVGFLAELWPSVVEEMKRRAHDKESAHTLERLGANSSGHLQISTHDQAHAKSNGNGATKLPDIPPPVLTHEKNEIIAIMGLMPRQAQIVKDTYGEVFDVRLIDGHGARSKLINTARDAACVYIMNKHVPIRDKEILKAVKAHMTFVPGGMSSLERLLEERMQRRTFGGNGAAVTH